MPVATTGDLYADQSNPQTKLEQPPPPAPPSDVPAPTKEIQRVVVKARMADEGADGKIRDTSTEALRAGNDLGFRNISDEEQKKPAPPPAEETKPPEPAEPPKEVPPAPPPEPKLYAGKFKTPEEMEKAYEEAQKLMTQKAQEAAELRRKVQETPPAPPPPKTPEQIAAEQAEANRILTEFTTDPKAFLEKRDQRIQQTTMVALSAQQVAEQWRRDNPDLAEHEIRVAFEATQLAQSDPELAKNYAALIDKATQQFRQFTGKLRTEGAKEALTQETRAIPLLQPSSSTPTTEQPSQKAPLTGEAAYDMHMRFLKEQEQRSHRGLRR